MKSKRAEHLTILGVLLGFLLAVVSAQAQNLEAAKVAWVVPLVEWTHSEIIQYGVAICDGFITPAGTFKLDMDPHRGDPSFGTYEATWVRGPFYGRYYLRNRNWVRKVWGEMSGILTERDGTVTCGVPAYFSDTVFATLHNRNHALACGVVDVVKAPNGVMHRADN
jgi:hypothetical protein